MPLSGKSRVLRALPGRGTGYFPTALTATACEPDSLYRARNLFAPVARTNTGFVTALPDCAAVDPYRALSEGAVTCSVALVQGSRGCSGAWSLPGWRLDGSPA